MYMDHFKELVQTVSKYLGLRCLQAVLKKKLLLRIHLCFYEDSDIHQCFLVWNLLLGKNRTCAHSTAHMCKQFNIVNLM